MKTSSQDVVEVEKISGMSDNRDKSNDVLNSRNPLVRTFGAPIRKSNYGYTKRFLDKASIIFDI